MLIGGGHSHVEVLRRFGAAPPPDTRLTVICRVARTPYSGMLPGLIAGHYRFEETHIDLEPLCRYAGARFVRDTVTGLDTAGRTVVCADGPPVPYDLLSINIGSAPSTAEVPGAAEHAVPVKPISRFLSHWETLLSRLHGGEARIAVVGGGAGGVELLLAIQHRLRGEPVQFHLVTDGDTLLPSHNPQVRAIFGRVMAARGVRVHTGHRVMQVVGGTLRCANGASLAFDEILWVTAAGAASWPAEAGLATDGNGFIEVGKTLQSTSHPEIFAAGDIAAIVGHPCPKAGVFAVRQGPPLARNLRRRLRGETLEPYIPQRRFLSLIGTGDRNAVLSRGGWTLQGRSMWRLKDWIDRRFVARFNDLV